MHSLGLKSLNTATYRRNTLEGTGFLKIFNSIITHMLLHMHDYLQRVLHALG